MKKPDAIWLTRPRPGVVAKPDSIDQPTVASTLAAPIDAGESAGGADGQTPAGDAEASVGT